MTRRRWAFVTAAAAAAVAAIATLLATSGTHQEPVVAATPSTSQQFAPVPRTNSFPEKVSWVTVCTVSAAATLDPSIPGTARCGA